MKNTVIKRICSLLVSLLFVLSVTACTKYEWSPFPISIGMIYCDIDDYDKKLEKIPYASDYMPNIEELEEYADISYSYRKEVTGALPLLPLFESHGITLFVKYSEDNYEQKKTEVLAKYDFIEEDIYDDGNGRLISPLADFEYKGYRFRADTFDEYDPTLMACKSFILVGYNDAEHKIAYCYFYDFDNDYIAASNENSLEKMHWFMDEYFHWNDVE